MVLYSYVTRCIVEDNIQMFVEKNHSHRPKYFPLTKSGTENKKKTYNFTHFSFFFLGWRKQKQDKPRYVQYHSNFEMRQLC